jgi:DNA-binding response OmpR family regulator
VRGVNVALVDDDAEIRESMRLLFESWGCVCFGGATAAAVEEELRARSAAPDALIVDYRLADAMTGLQVIERLRARFGEHLPALVITCTPNAALIRHQLAGIPFATKPVAPGKLRAFLSQVAREA